MAEQKKKALGRIPHSLSWLEEPQSEYDQHTQSSESTDAQQGLHDGWTRATFIIDTSLHKRVKAYAYWQRVTVKEVVDAALKQYFADKDVPSMPDNVKNTRNRLLDE